MIRPWSVARKVGHHMIVLRRIAPGPLLSSLNPGVSFFYEVSADGQRRAFTPDASAAQELFRELLRWAGSIEANDHAELIP